LKRSSVIYWLNHYFSLANWAYTTTSFSLALDLIEQKIDLDLAIERLPPEEREEVISYIKTGKVKDKLAFYRAIKKLSEWLP